MDPEKPVSRLGAQAGESHTLAALPFERRLERPWRIGSFTGLTSGADVEGPDRDASTTALRDREEEAAGAELSIHRYPRGARTGLAWHSVFEAIDFTRVDDATLHELVMAQLQRAGIGAAWARTTEDMVRDVLAAPLDDSGALRLDRVASERRISELGFFYPVEELRSADLGRILLDAGGERATRYAHSIRRFHFEPLRGYLRGFIDLVFEHDGRFYVVDYKSNYLGPSRSDYRPDRLEEAMSLDGYYFQYLLYVVAVHRLLKVRRPGYVYEDNFGGVFYLFLRGMDRSGGGVFFDLPPKDLVEALDRYFAADPS